MSGFYLCHMEEWGNFILEKEGLFLCFTVICCWQTGLPPHWCHPCHHQLICWAHPKGNQSWMFTGRTDAEAETPILWPPDVKNWLNWKRPWCWERLKAGGERDYRGWDGWMASPIQWTWVWAGSGSCWWTGRPGMLQSMGSQRVRHTWATELNWKDKNSWKS